MHAGLDQVGGKFAKDVGENPALRIDRRDEIGEDAMKIAHVLA